MMKRRGQAEIMDGLILMLVAATCSVILLSVSSDYGVRAAQIYEESSAQKLAQNTLLSLYHITDQDPNSAFYKKSIMVAVSQSLSKGDLTLNTPNDRPRQLISNVVEKYSKELGWNFMFVILPDGANIEPRSLIVGYATPDTPKVTSVETFKQNVGNPYCASAALTYTNSGGCSIGGSAGNMCYVIFEVCVWQT